MQQLKWKPSEFGLGEKPGEIWEAYLDDASYMIIPDKGMYELSHEDDEGNELSEPAYYAGSLSSFSIEIEDGRKYCVERVEATEFIKGDENAAA